jgi:AcrR family transcriptional regulator
MSEDSQNASSRAQDSSKRQERAHRILDAATALILRWGYNKTTIDDIARQAGVGKGTVYLHWNTREELFATLMKRERVELNREFSTRITADPAGWSLRSMLKYSALALMQRSLLKAVLLGDMDVLGKLAHREHSNSAYIERLAGFSAYLEFLREHDLVRTDLSLREQLYMLSAIFMGFFLIAPLVPNEITLTDDQLADLLAETVYRALESGRVVSDSEAQAISQTFTQYMNRAIEIDQAQLQRALDP